jgi:RNA polymerase sigma-70 factor (ECF subfamily)
MKEGCKKDFERISEYLDGELKVDICREIENHLRHCPECRECVDSLRKSIDLCKKAAEDEITPDMREHLRTALRNCFPSEQS